MIQQTRFTLIGLAFVTIISTYDGPTALVEGNVKIAIDAAKLALEASKLFANKIDAQQSPNGRFIRTVSNNGCLDGGKRSGWKENAPFPYHQCPLESHLRWRFDGPYLRMGASQAHFNDKEGCLDCSFGGRDCDVIVFECVGGLNQQWSVKVFDHQVDKRNRKVSFSIMHQGNSNQCLTRNPRQIHTFDHEECATEAHVASATTGWKNVWTKSKKTWAEAYDKCCMRKPTKSWDSYSLRDCTGNSDQSFYLDSNWLDELDKLGTEQPLGRK